MSSERVMGTMRAAAMALCAGVVVLGAAGCATPLIKVEVHEAQPVPPPRPNSGVPPLVSSTGQVLSQNPNTQAGQVYRAPSVEPGPVTQDGYRIARYPVPGTETLSITLLTKQSGQNATVYACVPGDQVVTVQNNPDRWISVGEKTQCISLANDQSGAVRYDPIRLPDRSVAVINGMPQNPYASVQGVQYLVNERTFDRDARRGLQERLPLAVLPDGRSTGQGIPVLMPEHPGRVISKNVIRSLVITRAGARLEDPR